MKYKLRQEFSIGDEYGNNETRCEVQLYITEENISKSKIAEMVYQLSLGFSELLEEENADKESVRNAQINWNEAIAENKNQAWIHRFQKKKGEN